MQIRGGGKDYKLYTGAMVFWIAINLFVCLSSAFLYPQEPFQLLLLLAFLAFEVLFGGCTVWCLLMCRTFLTVVTVDRAGVRATLFSKPVFSAAWEELEEIGIELCHSPKGGPIGTFSFSKAQAQKPEKIFRKLLGAFSTAREIVIIDDIEEFLKPALLQHIPLERLVWSREKYMSAERFYSFKAHALLELDKFRERQGGGQG